MENLGNNCANNRLDENKGDNIKDVRKENLLNKRRQRKINENKVKMK